MWKRPGERYEPIAFFSRIAFGGSSVMVWAGMSKAARTELVFVDRGTLNAQRYIEEILKDPVLPFAPFLGQNFLLVQDNARLHSARCIMQYLQEVGIRTLDWPTRSPDLNPIEHVWDMLGRNVR